MLLHYLLTFLASSDSVTNDSVFLRHLAPQIDQSVFSLLFNYEQHVFMPSVRLWQWWRRNHRLLCCTAAVRTLTLKRKVSPRTKNTCSAWLLQTPTAPVIGWRCRRPSSQRCRLVSDHTSFPSLCAFVTNSYMLECIFLLWVRYRMLW